MAKMRVDHRLDAAARKLARVLKRERENLAIARLYVLILERRLAGVTRDRLALARWKREHPNATYKEIKAAARGFGIPVSRKGFEAAIRRVHDRCEVDFERTYLTKAPRHPPPGCLED